ncbi:MAG: hypothetical protein NZL91_02935 [Thermoflexales bacterium]|nr:hypothetical protein [Thermoflexales bacterium]MDW8053729.1 hypothetical protein [Anaerolineae bacterium]MDW8293016.1 hypothetical protein [Anaerolineae bacterium]
MSLLALRAKLDRLSEQIVARFRDRAWFALNPAIYVPGAIPIAGRPELSLLEWSLEGLERYHASLGRYEVPDQHPLLLEVLQPSPVQRAISLPRLPKVPPLPREVLIRFYLDLLPRLCKPGDDPHDYGEVAYTDADLLARLNERIYLGAFVAYYKLEREPHILSLVGQPEVLRAHLRDPDREANVLAQVADAAQRFGCPTALMIEAFEWIMARALDLQVCFLQHFAALRAEAQSAAQG